MKQTKNAVNGLTLRAVFIEAAIADIRKDEGKTSGTACSEHLLMLAKGFPTAEGFIAACKQEEEFGASALGIEAVIAAFRKEGIQQEFTGTQPKTWSQTKSNIKRSMEMGLDITQYDTESALRKAKTEANAAKKAAADPGSKVDALVVVLAKAIKMLPADKQEAAMAEVTALTTKHYEAAKLLLAERKPVPIGKPSKVAAPIAQPAKPGKVNRKKAA